MKGFLRPLGAAGGVSAPEYGLNTRGLPASSASVSAGAATAADDAVGGRSRPPLRPQPPSARTAALRRMTAHPVAVGLLFRFTIKSPMRRHHTKIALFWRDLHKHEIAAKFLCSAQFSLFFESLEPASRLRQHILRRGPAKAVAAFHRGFHRKHA